ncbi:MAG: DEAD/DEAH box helicase family protein [Acidobacteriia bacterium]|nr:DEAD/DEAH box helicase family protein [Terriglobia bacterium]
MFEVLVKCFLQLDPKYRTILRNVWLVEEVPDSVRRHLGLPRRDEGIDLVAKTHTGDYWAVQCKFRSSSATSTRRELATFTDLAFGVCRNVSLGLVCTPANRRSRKLKLHKDRLEFCSGDVWESLDRNFFDRLRQLFSRSAISIKPRQPRPHQRQCVKRSHDHFVRDGNARGKLIMPCGTGKNLAAYWIASRLAAKTIVIAVPSLGLLRQVIEEWTRESVALKRQFSWIAVCSDDSVGDIDAPFLVQDLGFRVYTDPVEIARWLKTQRDGVTAIFTTYQSGPSVATAARRARLSFDLGIMDEAHRTAGLADGRFSHLLYDDNITIRQRLFMTATERRYRGESDQVISMDDVRMYGETFSLLSFKAALEAKPPILCDYKIITMVVLRDEVAELIRKNALLKPDKRGLECVEAEMLASAVALRRAMLKYPIRKALSFHSSVARARSFKKCQDHLSTVLPEFGHLATSHVSGSMPTGHRSEILRTFVRSRNALVTNARCLSEGVDIPCIDCVLFADPKNSVVNIVQAVGRALRPHPGKRSAYIIVPVVIDSKPTSEVFDSAFAPLLSVLRALASNDERIVEYFRTVSQGVRRVPHRIFSIDVPTGFRVEERAFGDAIQTRCWSRLARLSWRPFEEARKFVRSLGLKNQDEWRLYLSDQLPSKPARPRDIPSAPEQVYKNSGWLTWGDWLGTTAIASQKRTFRLFRLARRFVRTLGLNSHREWLAYCKGEMPDRPPRPEDIPSLPSSTYRSAGWKGWGDWLGTKYIANRNRRYLRFSAARAFARTLGLRGEAEWRRSLHLLPIDVPRKPEVVYKDKGWKGWGNWLGTDRVANQRRELLPFAEARKFVRRLKLKGYREWELYRTGKLPGKKPRPHFIPSDPYGHYKNKGWVSWPDWFGTA